MEFRQLEHFVAVAEERHFTRAAQRLHIVQSGLSASIRALERELDAALFVRSTRRVELTPAGRALLPEARRTLAAARSATEAVAAVQGLLRGSLAVGTMQILPPTVDLVAVLGRFHARHPGVELRLHQAGTGTLLEGVAAGALDLAMVAPVGPVPQGISMRPLASDQLLAACAPGHRLAGRDQVDLPDLAGEVVPRHPAAVRYLRLRPPVPTFEVAVATVGDPPASPAARALLSMLAPAA